MANRRSNGKSVWRELKSVRANPPPFDLSRSTIELAGRLPEIKNDSLSLFRPSTVENLEGILGDYKRVESSILLAADVWSGGISLPNGPITMLDLSIQRLIADRRPETQVVRFHYGSPWYLMATFPPTAVARTRERLLRESELRLVEAQLRMAAATVETSNLSQMHLLVNGTVPSSDLADDESIENESIGDEGIGNAG